jgi:hypothetical protein
VVDEARHDRSQSFRLHEWRCLQPTFTIEPANGYHGYLPTPEQQRLGAYETCHARSSYLETEAASKILEALMGRLD